MSAAPRGHESGSYGLRELLLARVGAGFAAGWGLGEISLPADPERSAGDPLHPAGTRFLYFSRKKGTFS